MPIANSERRTAHEPVPEPVFHFSSDVTARYILPGDRIVVSGPSNRVSYDPSLLWTCTRSREVLILDPKGHGPASDMSYRAHTLWTGAVFANAEQHRDEIRVFQSLGLSVAIPTWLGTQAAIQASGLETGSVDSIVDHNATGYIVMTQFRQAVRLDQKKRCIDVIRPVIAEYSRILTPKGRLIFQLCDPNLIFATREEGLEIVRTLLSEYGFSTTFYRVEDRYPIPISEEVACSFIEYARSANQQTSAGLSFQYVIEREGKLYLSFIPMYTSPDMYVGIKG